MADIKTVTVTLDAPQLAVILKGLDELPGKESRAVYAAVASQVQTQIKAAEDGAANGSDK